MALGLEIAVEEIDKKVVIRLTGRLDAATTPLLERRVDALLEEGKVKILVDFENVDYLSSAGMRLLLAATKKCKAKKGSFALFGATDEAMEIIKMAGFDKILLLFRTEKDALQHKM
jgi:anti-sigma B factor antagonist/stage II sporulation protein AA (anti-sigma F factor antagonist)